MPNKNIQKYINFYEQKVDEATQWGKKGKMGMVRSTMKDSVELLLDLIWNTEKGDGSKKNDFVNTISKSGYKLKFQVDRHLYTKKLAGLCECKTYLDRDMMARASSDFGRIKTGIKEKPKTFVLALEDAVGSEAYNYIMDEDNIDNVFYLLDGKRNPKKPIWKPKFRKSINVKKLEEFVTFIQKIK
jgi:hypothetical protein